MEEKAIYIINIAYLPTKSKYFSLILHILNRWQAQKKGCFETNQTICQILSLSESSISKDLTILKNDGWIEIENPQQPGKRVLKPSTRLFDFLSKETKLIIKSRDKNVKSYVLNTSNESKILPSKNVKSYPIQSKILPSKNVKSYPHNIITFNNNINKINEDFLEKKLFNFNLEFNSKEDLLKEIEDSNVYDLLKTIWDKDPPVKQEFEIVLQNWAKGNFDKSFSKVNNITNLFQGYLKNGLYLNIPLKERKRIESEEMTIDEMVESWADREILKSVERFQDFKNSMFDRISSKIGSEKTEILFNDFHNYYSQYKDHITFGYSGLEGMFKKYLGYIRHLKLHNDLYNTYLYEKDGKVYHG